MPGSLSYRAAHATAEITIYRSSRACPPYLTLTQFYTYNSTAEGVVGLESHSS